MPADSPARAGPAVLSATVSLSVPFHDVDPMRMVWHGRYPKYFELARLALQRRLGFDELGLGAEGYAFPVVDMRVRYLEPIRCAQQVLVHARLRDLHPLLRIGYEIVDAQSGARLTRASTVQVATHWPGGERCMADDPIVARLDAALRRALDRPDESAGRVDG